MSWCCVVIGALTYGPQDTEALSEVDASASLESRGIVVDIVGTAGNGIEDVVAGIIVSGTVPWKRE